MKQERKLGWVAIRDIAGRQQFIGSCLAIKGRQRGIERWMAEMQSRPRAKILPFYNWATLTWAGGLPHVPQMRPGPDWAAIERQGRR